MALLPTLPRSPSLPAESATTAGPVQGGILSTMVVEEANPPDLSISMSRTVAIIVCITFISGIGNLLGGLLTVSIPVIAADLQIPPELQLWPAAAYGLVCGCTLLPCGAIADVLGCRRACLLGGLLQAASALGAGLARTSTQLIALRGATGLAASFCLPGAVGVAAYAFPVTSSPRRRSTAFAAMGGGQAIGFGLGLALGGVFSDTVGWRWGFYTAALLNGAVLVLALWALPPGGGRSGGGSGSGNRGVDGALGQASLKRLAREIDWVGAFLSSASLALLSYALALATTVGSDVGQSMRRPLYVVLLIVGVALALLPAFGFWTRRQTRLGRPALIPTTLWANIPFTTICITVFLVWGALNASEQLTTLYLQDVRGVSSLTTSLYFMPAPVGGALMNIAIGLLLPYLRPSFAVPTACFVSAVAPLLLATLSHVDGPGYWRGVFQAMALNPLGADLIYTIANLVVTAGFPNKTQALAGGVFNMLVQIGKSVGIATSAVIARQITAQVNEADTKIALLRGYKAAWWYNCSLGVASVAVSSWGLRSVTKLGAKRE